MMNISSIMKNLQKQSENLDKSQEIENIRNYID